MRASKQQTKLDKATRAMLNIGSLPKDCASPKPTRKDKDKRFRLTVSKGKSKIDEVTR